jgi:hypothetical protein
VIQEPGSSASQSPRILAWADGATCTARTGAVVRTAFASPRASRDRRRKSRLARSRGPLRLVRAPATGAADQVPAWSHNRRSARRRRLRSNSPLPPGSRLTSLRGYGSHRSGAQPGATQDHTRWAKTRVRRGRLDGARKTGRLARRHPRAELAGQ